MLTATVILLLVSKVGTDRRAPISRGTVEGVEVAVVRGTVDDGHHLRLTARGYGAGVAGSGEGEVVLVRILPVSSGPRASDGRGSCGGEGVGAAVVGVDPTRLAGRARGHLLLHGGARVLEGYSAGGS